MAAENNEESLLSATLDSSAADIIQKYGPGKKVRKVGDRGLFGVTVAKKYVFTLPDDEDSSDETFKKPFTNASQVSQKAPIVLQTEEKKNETATSKKDDQVQSIHENETIILSPNWDTNKGDEEKLRPASGSTNKKSANENLANSSKHFQFVMEVSSEDLEEDDKRHQQRASRSSGRVALKSILKQRESATSATNQNVDEKQQSEENFMSKYVKEQSNEQPTQQPAPKGKVSEENSKRPLKTTAQEPSKTGNKSNQTTGNETQKTADKQAKVLPTKIPAKKTEKTKPVEAGDFRPDFEAPKPVEDKQAVSVMKTKDPRSETPKLPKTGENQPPSKIQDAVAESSEPTNEESTSEKKAEEPVSENPGKSNQSSGAAPSTAQATVVEKPAAVATESGSETEEDEDLSWLLKKREQMKLLEASKAKMNPPDSLWNRPEEEDATVAAREAQGTSQMSVNGRPTTSFAQVSRRFKSFGMTRRKTTWKDRVSVLSKGSLLEFSPVQGPKLYNDLLFIDSDGKAVPIPRSPSPQPESVDKDKSLFSSAESLDRDKARQTNAQVMGSPAITDKALTQPQATKTQTSVRKGTPMPVRIWAQPKRTSGPVVNEADVRKQLGFSPADQMENAEDSVELLGQTKADATPKSGQKRTLSLVGFETPVLSTGKAKRRISSRAESLLKEEMGSFLDRNGNATFTKPMTPSSGNEKSTPQSKRNVSVLDLDYDDELMNEGEAVAAAESSRSSVFSGSIGEEAFTPAPTATANNRQEAGLPADSIRRQIAEQKLELFRQAFTSLQYQMEEVKQYLFGYLEFVKPE